MDAPRYLLSEVPNNDEGKAFIKTLRQHLNKDRYRIRLRGNAPPKGEWRKYTYGVPLYAATKLRVYVEEIKKGGRS
jgi:hypothetical protein